jgi:general secretion pathway protein A
MVLGYYNLREHPFGVTPDSRYLFLSPTHREALASLLYGVDAGCGFLALIAKPGSGKTTLLFSLMNQLREKARTVFLFQTVSTPLDLLRSLLTGLGIQETRGSLVQLQSRLKEVLEDQARLGKRVVVLVDEAQNLDDSVLELIRILSNFETPREKLIQIIFSGQPQLADKIGSPGLEQLRQRVSIFARLAPFSREDTQLYIEHRLRTAGYTFEMPLFTRDALALIADSSEGIPRKINTLCFNSLALGCALQRKPIDTEVVREVIGDLDLGRWKNKSTAAVGPVERSSEPLPGILFAGGQPSVFAGWTSRIIFASLVVLLLGAGFLASHQWLGHKPPVHTETAPPQQPVSVPSPVPTPQSPATAEIAGQSNALVPPLNAENPSTSGNPEAPQAGAPESTVSVTPGKTLVGICVENFGKCNPEILREIRKLNPWLESNPDHIESGQTIRLPAAGSVAQSGKAIADGNNP